LVLGIVLRLWICCFNVIIRRRRLSITFQTAQVYMRASTLF
jgi:hypothetical protein